MKNLLNNQYDLLESKTFRYLYVYGGSLFSFLFLWVFEPFGLYNLTETDNKIIVIGLYVIIGLVLMIIQFFILQSYLLKKNTVLITILWIALSIFIQGTSASILNSYLFNSGQFYLKWFLYFQGVVLSISIIPISTFVLIHYSLTLKKRLKIATKLNESFKQKDNVKYNNKQNIIINSENKNEGFSINIDSFIFIRSVDNYIEVNILKNGKTEQKLIRYSLLKVEKDNKNLMELLRCHKSFIINKRKIESVIGNASGYKLKLCDYNKLIPISRKWNKDIHIITLL